MSESWSPGYRPRRWTREKEQFEAWAGGASISGWWRRRRFDIWREEQLSDRRRVAREAEQKRRAELVANPSAELIAAYQELRAAEVACGGRLGCARGADMTNPETVRGLARLLNSHADEFRSSIGGRRDGGSVPDTASDQQ